MNKEVNLLITTPSNIVLAVEKDNQIYYLDTKDEKNKKENILQRLRNIGHSDDKIKMYFTSLPYNVSNIFFQEDSINVKIGENIHILDIGLKNAIEQSIISLKKFYPKYFFPEISYENKKKNKFEIGINKEFNPRDYQMDCVNALLKTDKGIIHSPTGSGKTNIMAYLIAKSNNTALIIVPALDLVEQTKKRFLQIFGENVSIGTIDGTVSDKLSQINNNITISTWQSINAELIRELKGKHDIIIVDECHHTSANKLSSIITELSKTAKKIYGVSATPYRSSQYDEDKILQLFGNNIAHRVEINDLYSKGFLVRPTIEIINTGRYSLRNIATLKLIQGDLQKKKKESNGNYNDFVKLIAKKSYFVVANTPKNLLPYKVLPNDDIKYITSYDITQMVNFFQECFKKEADDNNKIDRFSNILLSNIKNPNSLLFDYDLEDTSLYSEKSIFEFTWFLQQTQIMYADNLLMKNPRLNPESWDDFAIKIGYLKKNIDGDITRQNFVYQSIKDKLEDNTDLKVLILANSVDWSRKIFKDLKEDYKNNKDVSLFYLNGSSKNKQDIYETIRRKNTNDHFILVATTDLIKEGIDLPSVNTTFVASPIFNPLSAIYSMEQLIGRGIRPFEGKSESKIFFYDAYTPNFKNRREEIYSTIIENIRPKQTGSKNDIYNTAEIKDSVWISNNKIK